MDFEAIVRTVTAGAIPILFAITLHEVAHGRVARRFGDRTAEMMGRLSLNPIRHIDPIGTVALPLIMLFTTGFMFGWAKPVPVQFRNLRNPKRDMIWVALAGPVSNIVMAMGWAFVLKVFLANGLAQPSADNFLYTMCRIGLNINILLAAFNLIPLPPLDGGRVLRGLVSEPLGYYLDRIEPFGLIIIVLLLVSGLLWVIVQPLLDLVSSIVLFVVSV